MSENLSPSAELPRWAAGGRGEPRRGRETDGTQQFSCALCRLRIFPLLSVSLCSCFPMPLLCLFLLQTLLLLAQLLAYPADSVYRRFYLPEPVLITVKPSSRILSHHPAFYAEISSFLSRTTCTGLFRKIQIGPNLFWLDVFIFVWSSGFQSTISKKKIEPLTVMENASSIISVLEREKIELGYIQSRVTTTTTVCRKPLKTLKSSSCFRKKPRTNDLSRSFFLSFGTPHSTISCFKRFE